MRTIIVVVVFALSVLSQPLGNGLHAEIQWPTTGPACSSFLQSSGADRDVLVSFMLGFAAGTNRERAGANQVMFGVYETEAKTLAFCRAHPGVPLADAAFALVDEVKGR